jgi:hypothetical protein
MTESRVTLRLPPALHTQLAARASEQAISLNQLMVALLAGGVGFKVADHILPITNAELERQLRAQISGEES